MVVMPKKNGMETTTSKRVVTWLQMNGFTIIIIRAGSTSRLMVLMQIKNGMETTISKWVATWPRVNGFTITIIRVGFT